MNMILCFVLLQVADFVTTLVGFNVGASEASPFVRYLMQHLGPTIAVVFAKLLALGLAGCCIWLGKRHVVRWANVWYAVLCLWNTGIILVTLAA